MHASFSRTDRHERARRAKTGDQDRVPADGKPAAKRKANGPAATMPGSLVPNKGWNK
jgi:hypothetical protein